MSTPGYSIGPVDATDLYQWNHREHIFSTKTFCSLRWLFIVTCYQNRTRFLPVSERYRCYISVFYLSLYLNLCLQLKLGWQFGQAKRTLYLTLVRSKLLYCSPLWRPYLTKDFLLLERVQRRVTKFILNNYIMDYKTRLTQLNLLPVMYVLELHDILFFNKVFKDS